MRLTIESLPKQQDAANRHSRCLCRDHGGF